ncbi:MAG: hypothetical protein QNJ84_11910 [Alphaproteobacteria bacterium]|nr:hypothetical protein [Alphaproteobacteria bacterium]
MIRLGLPKEPYWLDMPHGVRLFVRPLTTAIYEAARAKGARLAGQVVGEHAEILQAGGSVEGLPDLEDADAVVGLSQFLFAQALAVSAIIRWEGVLAAEGGAADVSEETVFDLMRIHSVADDFLHLYTRPHREVIAEGNASRPSPNGASALGRDTAQDAGPKNSAAPTAA